MCIPVYLETLILLCMLLSIMMIPVYCVCTKNHVKDVSIFSNIYQKDLSFEDMLFKKHSFNEKGQYAVMR